MNVVSRPRLAGHFSQRSHCMRHHCNSAVIVAVCRWRSRLSACRTAGFGPGPSSPGSEAALERLPTFRVSKNLGAPSPRAFPIPLPKPPPPSPTQAPAAPGRVWPTGDRSAREAPAGTSRAWTAGEAPGPAGALTVLPERRGAGGRPQRQRQGLGDRPAEIHRARRPALQPVSPRALRGAGNPGEPRPGEGRRPLPSPAPEARGGPGCCRWVFCTILPRPQSPGSLAFSGVQEADGSISGKGQGAEKWPPLPAPYCPATVESLGEGWFARNLHTLCLTRPVSVPGGPWVAGSFLEKERWQGWPPISAWVTFGPGKSPGNGGLP